MTSPPPPRNVPGVARDPSSMTAILDDLAASGFTRDFVPAGRDRPGAIRCPACHQVADASEFTVEQLRRMEGASDPDEMLLIAALRCPHCHAGGALVLTYGPEVTEVDAPILQRLPDSSPPHPNVVDPTPEAALGSESGPDDRPDHPTGR